MTTKLRCQVFHKGDLVKNCEFIDPIVRIGHLPTSHLQLEGLARMHAVLERTSSRWQLIPFPSGMGTVLNGDLIDQNTALPEKGCLGFGDWTVVYEIEEASQEVFTRMMDQRTQMTPDMKELKVGTADAEHHRTMMEGLTGEIKRLSSTAAKQIEELGLDRMWSSIKPEDKRHGLRKLVTEVRHLRKETLRIERQRVASMLEIGPSGILAIYDMTPDQALNGAVDALFSVSVAKTSLEWLAAMDLIPRAKKAANENTGMVTAILAGHNRLVERLQTTMTGGSALLLAYISRAGGHELTDQERFEMKRAFDEIERASKPANGPSSE